MTKKRRILLSALGALMLGAAVTGVSIIRAYDDATRIDRSVAKVVVRQYIDAALVERDEAESSLYICDSPENLSAISRLRDDIEQAEAKNGYATQIALSRSVEMAGGSVVEVEMQLNQGVGTGVRTRIIELRFHLKNQDGWRICAAERLPEPNVNPSATPPTAS